MKIIALDAMGGDYAPKQIVLGAFQAASEVNAQIILVGIEDEIRRCLPGPLPKNITIRHASEVVGMEEKPLEALRKKKDNSISVSVNLVKEGIAHAIVSAGNTGAATAASLLGWRQMPGIHRPAIATVMPNKHGNFLLLDAGASPDIDPEQLVEFAIMGRAYAELVLDKHNPKVHLLNMGEEPGKGNAFVKQAYTLLSKHDWFAGNCEGKDLAKEKIDVVVCDAFVGNIVLKTAEGVAEFIMSEIKDAIPTSFLAKLPYAPMKKLFAPLRKKMDYAEYGGSPLLGLNHLCVICHGRSNAKAIYNAIKVCEKALDSQLVPRMKTLILTEEEPNSAFPMTQ